MVTVRAGRRELQRDLCDLAARDVHDLGVGGAVGRACRDLVAPDVDQGVASDRHTDLQIVDEDLRRPDG